MPLSPMPAIHLYRPVGLKELQLIVGANKRAFPPRLPHQPIFYPVLTFEYAERIISDWNRHEEEAGFAGFITQFDVDAKFVQRYPAQVAGGRRYQELWVPAEDLSDFNRHIIGPIRVIHAIYGTAYSGEPIPLDPCSQRDPSALFVA